jgi:3-oxoadipate enol-lactonase
MEHVLKAVSLGRYRLRYLDEGVGLCVILIHGLAGDHSAWLAQVEALRNHYRVIAFDNRGAGKSTQLDEPVTTEDLAADTLSLMEYLKIERAHVVGRSMGGAVAQHMALQAPDRVLSLALCASFAQLDPLGRRVLSNMREALEPCATFRAKLRIGGFFQQESGPSRRDRTSNRRRNATAGLLHTPE